MVFFFGGGGFFSFFHVMYVAYGDFKGLTKQ